MYIILRNSPPPPYSDALGARCKFGKILGQEGARAFLDLHNPRMFTQTDIVPELVFNCVTHKTQPFKHTR